MPKSARVDGSTVAVLTSTLTPRTIPKRPKVCKARCLEARKAISVVTTPVPEELPPDRRRKSFTLQRGNFLQPMDPVEPGVPAAFHEFPAGHGPDRLGFADWLTRPENPLTARVAVNRLWARLFGRGLVETEEDFGNQGSLPSHPELLDWLAYQFMEQGWDQKAILRQMVLSSTYRQQSRVSEAVHQRDPQNTWLGRGPSFRLEAELVRDQALAVSGLLSRKMFGPPVYPPQPDGIWQAAFNGQRTWPTSTGEDRYRRGLYTFLRRTAPYPSMEAFDAPNREICTPRRIRTNTPLQVFVTLNDPVFWEASQALGRRMWTEGSDSDKSRIERGLWLALQRPPNAADVQELLALLADVRTLLAGGDSDSLQELALDPLGPLPEGLDLLEAAAYASLGNAILNLDAVLSKD